MRLVILLGIVAIYLASALTLPGGIRGLGDPAVYRRLVAIAALGAFPLVFALIAFRIRGGGPPATGWPAAVRRARADGWFSDRVMGYLLVLAVLPFFFWAFAVWKTRIQPFTWDLRLAGLERRVHGIYPHRWLRHDPVVVAAMDRWYWTWNYMLISVVLWQAWCGPRQDRLRFWLAFVLTWIGLGTVLAHLVASAGPGFFLEVTGTPGPYGDLREHLAAADAQIGLHLFEVRAYLWQAVHQQKVVFGGGISAFPSLHVAMPTLAACAAFRVSRWLCMAFLVYALITLICGVGLGWHYAVDGYASFVLVPAIWFVAGWLTRRLDRV